MSPPRLTLIAALAQNRAIGRHNTLPWHLPEDLQHFKKTTLGHTVVMGRRTFDAIGRPLPGRHIVVLTRDPRWQHAGCTRADSLEQALALSPAEDVFIAGGAQIYAAALARADRMLLTHIDTRVPDADAFFPEWSPTEWQLHEQSAHQSRTGLRYTLQAWHRRPR
jgi:dihydrofolate reductase